LNTAVIILFNLPRSPGERPPGGSESDAGVLAEVAAVEEALGKLGFPCRRVGVRRLSEIAPALAGGSEKVAFNLVEDLHDLNHDVNFVPAVCRALGKACTGSEAACLNLCLDKWQAKAALEACGVPTPPALVVPLEGAIRRSHLPEGRLIVKPLRTDASEGIDAASVIAGPGAQLEAAVRRVHQQFRQPALIEQFIAGREINVSVLQRGDQTEVLPLAEIDFSTFPPDKPRIVDYGAKWLSNTFEFHHTPRIIPAPVSEKTAALLRKHALAAWRAVGGQDYGRVDFRLDEQDRPYVLEVNPNPDIAPDAGFAAALAAADIPFHEFVRTVTANARERLTHARPRGSANDRRHSDPQVNIRWSRPEDRDGILKFMVETGFFHDYEMEIAREVLDEALGKGPEGHYQSYTAELDGQPVGWVCFGLVPCTQGTYDLYWIAVSRQSQGRGVGADLMRVAEKLIAERGGRVIVVETSSRPLYHPTRQFYLKLGYREESHLHDFYAPGDGKVTFVKRLG
jgi:D-alanine-D-alanine ligase